MFHPDAPRSKTRTIFGMAELVYHSVVREIRKTHRNALVGLFMNMLQTVMLVMTFFAMFSIMGMRGSAIRGDFLMYIMLFVYHVAVTPLVIDHAAGAMGMLLVAWFSGVAVGMIFLALKPWAPETSRLLTSLYSRISIWANSIPVNLHRPVGARASKAVRMAE